MTADQVNQAIKKALREGSSGKGLNFAYREEDGVGVWRCPMCGYLIHPTSFKDELSVREFTISGMCQECQDKVFGEPEPERPGHLTQRARATFNWI